VAFTGLNDVDQAIAGYTHPALVGTKWISLGGGNSAGIINVQILEKIATTGPKIKAAGYEGVMFDVEEVYGSHGDIVPAFQKTFANLKGEGLLVGVTTSHSAPYWCYTAEDAIEIVKAWVADDNIDVISPQLYTSGYERAPMFDETGLCVQQGCTWDLYKGFKGKFAPSICTAGQYGAVQSYFSSKYGIECEGFFEWSQRRGTRRSLNSILD